MKKCLHFQVRDNYLFLSSLSKLQDVEWKLTLQ